MIALPACERERGGVEKSGADPRWTRGRPLTNHSVAPEGQANERHYATRCETVNRSRLVLLGRRTGHKMPRKKSELERVAISKRLRFEVFKRDDFACQYCGATPPGVLLHCDHIEPVSKGGKTEIDNLVTACEHCNQGKSDVPLSSVPQSLESRAAEVVEREAQIAGYQQIMKARRDRLEDDARQVLGVFCDFFGMDSIPRNNFISIKYFVEQIGLDTCAWAAELASDRNSYSYPRAFKYFCGICWNKLRPERMG